MENKNMKIPAVIKNPAGQDFTKKCLIGTL